jgi:hypothetical protein
MPSHEDRLLRMETDGALGTYRTSEMKVAMPRMSFVVYTCHSPPIESL